MMKRLINQKAFFEAMKKGILIAVIIIVLVAAAAIVYWQSQPVLSEERIKECENTPDKSACIKEEKQLLKCQENMAPGEKGITDLKECVEAVTGPRKEPANCNEQPELPECRAIAECASSENPGECARQSGGEVSAVFETSS
jgi:hypothetical protein